MNWESVTKCPNCGGSVFTDYLTSDRPDWYDSQPLHLSECENCHLVFANPRPDRYEANVEYLKGRKAARDAIVRKNERKNVYDIHRTVIETASSFLDRKPKAIFDMGFGSGSLLEVAADIGLEAWGNDINKAAVEHLSNKGIHALHGFSKDLELPAQHFDIVTNLDYIEHTYEPMDDLRMCNNILAPGGILYLKTLYLDCAAHLMAEDGWKLFGRPFAEGHFCFYWPRVIRDMIKNAGFSILDIRIAHLITIVAQKTDGESGAGDHNAR